MANDGRDRLIKIRIPTKTPLRSVIPPTPRPGSEQLTCVRYDQHGAYYIDRYVENSKLHGVVREGRRYMTYVVCPKFEFNVALAVCNVYCSTPCDTHLRELSKRGWYDDGKGDPPLSHKTGRGKAEQRKKNSDDE